VVETEMSFNVLPASALANDVDPRSALQFHKPQASGPLDAALKTRTGRIFMDFARFPWAQTEEDEEGFDVRIHDLRFYTNSGPRGFLAEIELDKALRVRSESFSFTGRGIEAPRDEK
jgi:hypothetical protein